MRILDVKDGPILQAPVPEPSTSSKYGLWGMSQKTEYVEKIEF